MHGRLLIVLEADLVDQAELNFEPVDMIFRGIEYFDEDLSRYVVTHRFTVG